MAAGTLDITIESGATWRLGLTLTEADTTPTDVTGWEVRMQVRVRAGAADPPLVDISEVPGDDGEITVGGVDGHLTLRISPQGTLKLRSLKKAAYDVFIEKPGTEVDKLLKGAVTIDPNVTDPTYD